jgi:hypothetical protein
MEPVESKICSLKIEEAKCTLKPCRGCGFSFPEIERRKALPLVKLDNGLYGKIVGQRKTPEE